MSTTNTLSPVDVVRALYGAFERHDVEAVLSCFDENVEISQSEELPWGGLHHGHDGAMRFFGSLMSHIATQVEVDRLLVAGDTVVETGRTTGMALSSGREFSIAETHVFKVRDGKVVRMEAYVDNAAMLDALAGG